MMNKEPLVYVLYSLIVGLLLYIVFRFIMSYTDHFAQITAIIISCFTCVYLLVFYEFRQFVQGLKLIVNTN